MGILFYFYLVSICRYEAITARRLKGRKKFQTCGT